MDEQDIISDILTFDELLEDEYYNTEFEKRVQQRLDINSHSGVKGGHIMDNIQQTQKEGEIKEVNTVTPTQVEPVIAITEAVTPTVKPTEATKPGEEDTTANTEPAKEMTAGQFELYNETLRRVSKTAKGGLRARYNAFEDAEVKALVKEQILNDEKPDIAGISAGVVTRLTPPTEPPKEKPKTTQKKPKEVDEVLALKAELALVKAGIVPDRLEAAKKLFIADGGDPEKVADFVAKYPEWKNGASGGITFTKAPPIAGKTAPTPSNQPVLNDFERKVAAARKRAGLD